MNTYNKLILIVLLVLSVILGFFYFSNEKSVSLDDTHSPLSDIHTPLILEKELSKKTLATTNKISKPKYDKEILTLPKDHKKSFYYSGNQKLKVSPQFNNSITTRTLSKKELLLNAYLDEPAFILPERIEKQKNLSLEKDNEYVNSLLQTKDKFSNHTNNYQDTKTTNNEANLKAAYDSESIPKKTSTPSKDSIMLLEGDTAYTNGLSNDGSFNNN